MDIRIEKTKRSIKNAFIELRSRKSLERDVYKRQPSNRAYYQLIPIFPVFKISIIPTVNIVGQLYICLLYTSSGGLPSYPCHDSYISTAKSASPAVMFPVLSSRIFSFS